MQKWRQEFNVKVVLSGGNLGGVEHECDPVFIEGEAEIIVSDADGVEWKYLIRETDVTTAVFAGAV